MPQSRPESVGIWWHTLSKHTRTTAPSAWSTFAAHNDCIIRSSRGYWMRVKSEKGVVMQILCEAVTLTLGTPLHVWNLVIQFIERLKNSESLGSVLSSNQSRAVLIVECHNSFFGYRIAKIRLGMKFFMVVVALYRLLICIYYWGISFHYLNYII